MPYLIDGYNLAHAMNLMSGALGPQGLEVARLKLLDHVCRAPDKKICVVFDASASPRNAPSRQVYKGILVLFAKRGSADDLIEELIAEERYPEDLIVVSDDNRLRLAGHRRGCSLLGCL